MNRYKSRARRGGITLEFLLAFPVLLIGLLAVIQFGVFFANTQQIALASRVGAEYASQVHLPNRQQYGVPPTARHNRVPEDIVHATLQQLRTAGMEPCCIILEHNTNTFRYPHGSGHYITPRQVLVTEFGGCYCIIPKDPLPPNSVRLTICVNMPQVMPNCLGTFGFDVRGSTVQHSSVFRFER